MRAIAPLIAGIRGAELGTVSVRKRGTSTAAAVYQSFEGGAQFPAGDLSLNEDGAVVAYVDELVTVQVTDASGVVVRTFDDGEDVTSVSFSGVDYDTGQSGANEPTTLDTILAAWIASAGATDFEVLFESASTPIQDILTRLTGIRNVKSSAFGAVGDGVEDDTAAIQAAINAGDGEIYLPPGVYRLTSPLLTVDRSVTLRGAGKGATFLRMSNSSNEVLNITPASGAVNVRVADLAIDASTPHTVDLIEFSTGAFDSSLIIERCAIGGSNWNGAGTTAGVAIRLIATADVGMVTIRDCDFSALAGASSAYLYGDPAGGAAIGRVVVLGNRFDCVDQKRALLGVFTRLLVTANDFKMSWSFGNATAIDDLNDRSAFAAGQWVIVGNTLKVSTAGAPLSVLFRIGTASSAAHLIESGNITDHGNSTAPVDDEIYGQADFPDVVQLASRADRWVSYSSANATTTVFCSQAGVVDLSLTGATGARVVNLSTNGNPDGARTTLIIGNATGGSVDVDTNIVSRVGTTSQAWAREIKDGDFVAIEAVWDGTVWLEVGAYQDRALRVQTQTATGTSVTIDADEFGTGIVTYSNASTTPTITLVTTDAIAGQVFNLKLTSTLAAVQPTFTNALQPSTVDTIGVGETNAYSFFFDGTNWVQLTESAAVA